MQTKNKLRLLEEWVSFLFAANIDWSETNRWTRIEVSIHFRQKLDSPEQQFFLSLNLRYGISASDALTSTNQFFTQWREQHSVARMLLFQRRKQRKKERERNVITSTQNTIVMSTIPCLMECCCWRNRTIIEQDASSPDVWAFVATIIFASNLSKLYRIYIYQSVQMCKSEPKHLAKWKWKMERTANRYDILLQI